MQRIYLFMLEIPTVLCTIELTASTKNELFNVAMIIAIRFAFHLFEKKYPSVREGLKNRFKKTEV